MSDHPEISWTYFASNTETPKTFYLWLKISRQILRSCPLSPKFSDTGGPQNELRTLCLPQLCLLLTACQSSGVPLRRSLPQTMFQHIKICLRLWPAGPAKWSDFSIENKPDWATLIPSQAKFLAFPRAWKISNIKITATKGAAVEITVLLASKSSGILW